MRLKEGMRLPMLLRHLRNLVGETEDGAILCRVPATSALMRPIVISVLNKINLPAGKIRPLPLHRPLPLPRRLWLRLVRGRSRQPKPTRR